MYAIVEMAGQQFKVSKDQKVYVHRLPSEEGANVNFDKVLLVDNDGKITIGAPAIQGASVKATILRHLKDDKVIVFKKKRRKGYKKKNGHRQYLTEIKVDDILVSGVSVAGSTKKASAKKEAKGDDLTKIEGIGPKVKEIFNEAGIVTFADLSTKTVQELKDILAPKGGRYAGMTPDTWPKQAELAAAGKWDELKVWQDELDGGR